ncbi:MAG: paraquat-inducible protein A [Planctomycetaceae bacterium]|nr:paraquat-inducible protein A [Planctomycetaceae bacterium]
MTRRNNSCREPTDADEQDFNACRSTPRTNAAQRRLFFTLIAMQIAAFFIGIFSPLMTFTVNAAISVPVFDITLYYDKTTFSLLESVLRLFTSGNRFLGAVIFVFSICFPLIKTILLIACWRIESKTTIQNILRRLETIGKWSMLDVYVVSVILCITKLSGMNRYVDVSIHWGLYLFVISVFLSMFASGYTQKVFKTNR